MAGDGTGRRGCVFMCSTILWTEEDLRYMCNIGARTSSSVTRQNMALDAVMVFAEELDSCRRCRGHRRRYHRHSSNPHKPRLNPKWTVPRLSRSCPCRRRGGRNPGLGGRSEALEEGETNEEKEKLQAGDKEEKKEGMMTSGSCGERRVRRRRRRKRRRVG